MHFSLCISITILAASLSHRPVSAQCGSGTFHAEAVLSGSSWTVRNGNTTVYTGINMLEAMRSAVGSLSPGRSSKQSVVVRGSGSMPANQSLDLPSYTIIDICGTINVTGTAAGDNAVIRGQIVRDVEVRYLTVTGNPYFGVFFRRSSNVILGQIDLRLSSGHGVRIDNDPSGSGNYGNSNRVTNIHIDNVYVSGTNNHGVETYGVEGITIGTVTARDVAYSGLLLNATINATVTRVDAENTGAGTGYAAFRLANRAGRVGNNTGVNIRVGEVRARGGGRGFFCVSESGGAVIDRIDFANTGNNSILIENCYNVNVAALGGTVSGGGEIRISARTEFANTADITLQNLTTNVNVTENPCAIRTVLRNIALQGSARVNACVATPVLRGNSYAYPTRLSAFSSGASLLIRIQSQNDGFGVSASSTLRVTNAGGRVIHEESLPDFGVFERKIETVAGGIYLVTLESGREKVARLVPTAD